MCVESHFYEPIESAADDRLLGRHGTDPHQQHNRSGIESIHALVVERVEDQRPQLLVRDQLLADLPQDLNHAIDVFAV